MYARDKTIYAKPWFVYVARCRDNTLYAGVALDVDKRLQEHNTSNKCRYTRFRKPLKLVYKERCGNYGAARRRENEIKKFSRKKKLALVALCPMKNKE